MFCVISHFNCPKTICPLLSPFQLQPTLDTHIKAFVGGGGMSYIDVLCTCSPSCLQLGHPNLPLNCVMLYDAALAGKSAKANSK